MTFSYSVLDKSRSKTKKNDCVIGKKFYCFSRRMIKGKKVVALKSK